MRLAHFSPIFLFCASVCWAQAPATPQTVATPEKVATPAPSTGIEKSTERLHVEDTGARIDELRIGGETKTIDVQPKGGMPAYQVQPKSGERSWKILGF